MPDQFNAHCDGCPYSPRNCAVRRAARRLPLTMEHNPNSTALLILEAPGQQEWESRRPICSNQRSSVAARFRCSFERINSLHGPPHVSRRNFSITNAVQCLPLDKPPLVAARGQCARWLLEDIQAHQWRRVVVFGQHAELSVRCLGYGLDGRFRFVAHPSHGRLTKADLDSAILWALER